LHIAATIFYIQSAEVLLEGFTITNGTSFTQLIATVVNGSLEVRDCSIVSTFGELISSENSVILWNNTLLYGCAAQTFFSLENSMLAVSRATI
jgi:hypothetical protein